MLEVPRPKRSYEVRRTDPVVVARVRALAPEHTDSQIAALLDKEGFRSGTQGSFTAEEGPMDSPCIFDPKWLS